MEAFHKGKIEKFFKVRYTEVLKQPFNDEQLYYYYDIKILDFNDILKETKNFVLQSSNASNCFNILVDTLFVVPTTIEISAPVIVTYS